MSNSNQFFTFRKVLMTDDSELYEVVTQDGKRIVTSTPQWIAFDISDHLNDVLQNYHSKHTEYVAISYT